MTPLDALRVKPVGRLPDDTVHAYGVVPPVASKLAEYDAPTVPPDKLDVEIERACVAAAIAILSDAVAVLPAASATFTVKVEVPDVVGVPEIAPDEAFKLSPAGSDPLLKLQEYGVVPPLACNIAEYAVPVVPLGRADVEIAKDPPDPPCDPEAPMTPAHPFTRTTDVITADSKTYSRRFVMDSLRRGADKEIVPPRKLSQP
jgi:hypothetical protein